MSVQHNTQHVGDVHLPKSFRRIRLELAREPENPEGRADWGYLFSVPLDVHGKIDRSLCKDYGDFFRVLKFRPARENDIGHIVHDRAGWRFHYDIVGEDPDEAGFHFEDEKFVPGEYVSIRDGNKIHVYKVATVEHY